MAPSVADEAVEIDVRSVGLNFRDVLNVRGMYPGDPGLPGSDAAGVVTRVGAKVCGFKPGDRVMGFFNAPLGSRALGHSRHVVHTKLEWAAASSMPTVGMTVEYGLRHCCSIAAGDRVLIHLGAGGVGLTAIQYALGAGAVVYATCSDELQASMLSTRGVEYIASSRQL